MKTEPEEIRRVIAWQLCDAMPPNDTVLRELYADNVSLNSLGVDSLDLVEIAMSIEEKFPEAGDISDDDETNLQTVGDIIGLVQSKIEVRNSKIS